jgi:hypothetical protein
MQFAARWLPRLFLYPCMALLLATTACSYHVPFSQAAPYSFDFWTWINKSAELDTAMRAMRAEATPEIEAAIPRRLSVIADRQSELNVQLSLSAPPEKWRRSQETIVALLEEYDLSREGLVERLDAQPPMAALDQLIDELATLRQRVTSCYAQSKACKAPSLSTQRRHRP